jgi:catechol 2,3-dioxygenase-like lactoylglutathione lyase family enzyme
MFSHIMLGSDNFERACRFYDAMLAPLGIERVDIEAPDYCGAYVRDPDGHNLHFVRRGDDAR